ncbi:chitin deacetylase [Boothiomyces sp. JEL0866]|nr:chitin deacetylase [Boothiomyces sp. JEL0866]
MNYPDTEIGGAVPVSQEFSSQYKSAIGITTGPAASWEKTGCIGKTDWALTYDDGPSPNTPMVLSELAKHGYKSTFFVVGSQVKKYPEILQQAYQAGMEIGVHTWTHPYLTHLTNEQIVSEIMYTFHIIKDVLGIECRYVRAPYGDTNDRVRGVIKSLGFILVRWNRDTDDAITNGASVVPKFDSFMKQPLFGTISLEHDLHIETAKQTPYGMDKLSKSSYTERTISQCTGEQPYGRIDPHPLNITTTATQSTLATTTALTTYISNTFVPPVSTAGSTLSSATVKSAAIRHTSVVLYPIMLFLNYF